MAYEENMPRMEGAHHVILEGREQLSVSGVEEVERFDENTVVLSTAQGGLEIQGEGLHIEKLSLDGSDLQVEGTLVVRGEDLHIEKLSLDGGDLRVEGVVDSLSYEDDSRERGGFFARLLR